MWFGRYLVAHKRKFIIIAAAVQQQAKQIIKNLKEELENNDLLRKDLWPFEEDGSEWNSYSLVIKKLWARISIISTDQSVRGIRHKNHRPDLIICDDIEDIQSMKTKEGRDRLFEWFTRDLIPLEDMKKTKIVLLGNMLHPDSLVMRIGSSIVNGTRSGIFFRFPILNEQWECIWPERYTKEDIEILKKMVGSEVAWRTEYLLENAGYEWQVIKPEWIHWEEVLPDKTNDFYPHRLKTWVDLAISESNSADYTAFVTGSVWGYEERRKVYITHAFQARMDFPKTIETLQIYDGIQKAQNELSEHVIVVEDIWYQRAIEQQLRHSTDVDVELFRPLSSKRERLILVSDLIKKGVVIFIRTPFVEWLVEQILWFGKETHNDLVDAFVMMILKVMEKQDREDIIYFIW